MVIVVKTVKIVVLTTSYHMVGSIREWKHFTIQHGVVRIWLNSFSQNSFPKYIIKKTTI
jgi:hypothetical protein